MARHIAEYSANDEGSYIIEACMEGKWLCFHTTRRFVGVGRYVNHATHRTATAKLFCPLMVRGKFRIALMPTCNLDPREDPGHMITVVNLKAGTG